MPILQGPFRSCTSPLLRGWHGEVAPKTSAHHLVFEQEQLCPKAFGAPCSPRELVRLFMLFGERGSASWRNTTSCTSWSITGPQSRWGQFKGPSQGSHTRTHTGVLFPPKQLKLNTAALHVLPAPEEELAVCSEPNKCFSSSGKTL